MGQDDVGTKSGIPGETVPQDGIESINVASIVRGLVYDLEQLRAGKITVQEANARSKLAHEILRGINYVLVAQRALLGQLQTLPSPSETKPKSARRGPRGRVIDV